MATDYSAVGGSCSAATGEPAAELPVAVCASCAIPAWYAPVRIGGRTYIDGGTASNASVDLVPPGVYDEVYVLAPMAAVRAGQPDARRWR